MHIQHKPALLNNLSLKIFALLFGYIFWRSMSDHQQIAVALDAPISFYNETALLVETRDAVTVKLYGPRNALYQIPRNLGIHIDASALAEGTQTVALDEKNLFLPDSIKLVHYKPATIELIASKRDKEPA